MRIDLHVHTTASDGTLTPTQLVQLAATNGLHAIAITDHDSVDGVPEALEAALTITDSPLVIPGVELSAVHSDRDVHILGYFVDHRDPTLLGHLADLRGARMSRAATIVDALSAAGYQIELKQVLALSAGGAVGRSHVARALVAQGVAHDVSDAFVRLLGRGRPFYVPKDVRTPVDVVSIVRAAGGVPVLAHPGVTGSEDLIPELAERGLAGIEAFHSEHDETERRHFAALAERFGLVATGGTDYHGPETPNGELGTVPMPSGTLEALYAAAGRVFPPKAGSSRST